MTAPPCVYEEKQLFDTFSGENTSYNSTIPNTCGGCGGVTKFLSQLPEFNEVRYFDYPYYVWRCNKILIRAATITCGTGISEVRQFDPYHK
ncbi:hypothetical protein J6590_017739 [Homalodisca vitripennis]|nr:hypothetical protein J6590_017739 [Homalodisca vitripennis]